MTSRYVALVGDTHGSTWALQNVLDRCAELGVGTAVQLGDFGWHGRSQGGQKFLRDARDYAKRVGVRLASIDGNHEDHHYLREVVQSNTRTDEGFYLVGGKRSWLQYIPRGAVWTWGNTTFAALGGAFSIDRSRRVLNSSGLGSYFEEEMITHADVERLYANAAASAPVNVLLTHDSPTVPPPFAHNWKAFPQTTDNQRFISDAAERLRVRHVVHGHMHIRYTAQGPTYKTHGLSYHEAPFADLVAFADTETGNVLGAQEFMYTAQ